MRGCIAPLYLALSLPYFRAMLIPQRPRALATDRAGQRPTARPQPLGPARNSGFPAAAFGLIMARILPRMVPAIRGQSPCFPLPGFRPRHGRRLDLESSTFSVHMMFPCPPVRIIRDADIIDPPCSTSERVSVDSLGNAGRLPSSTPSCHILLLFEVGTFTVAKSNLVYKSSNIIIHVNLKVKTYRSRCSHNVRMYDR